MEKILLIQGRAPLYHEKASGKKNRFGIVKAVKRLALIRLMKATIKAYERKNRQFYMFLEKQKQITQKSP